MTRQRASVQNQGSFTNLHVHYSERKNNQRKKVNQQSQEDRERKMEGDGEIKIYSRWIWDGFDGGGGYISE